MEEEIKYRYMNSRSLGSIREDRIQPSVEKGLIVYDYRIKDYMLTRKAMTQYKNFFMWLNGNVDTLLSRISLAQKKEEQNVFEDFDKM